MCAKDGPGRCELPHLPHLGSHAWLVPPSFNVGPLHSADLTTVSAIYGNALRDTFRSKLYQVSRHFPINLTIKINCHSEPYNHVIIKAFGGGILQNPVCAQHIRSPGLKLQFCSLAFYPYHFTLLPHSS